MGIHQEKYTYEYFTGADSNGQPVGYGAPWKRMKTEF